MASAWGIWYNGDMKSIRTGFLAGLAFLAGCAGFSFETLRSQRFVDDSNRYVSVDYGREETARESTFVTPAGLRLPFKSKLKVRVEMPDGARFIAYQRMSVSGNMYVSDDGRWEYLEEGLHCVVAERAADGRGYELRFQGFLCASMRDPKEKTARISSGTPHGFGRESEGPRESSGPRTVE